MNPNKNTTERRQAQTLHKDMPQDPEKRQFWRQILGMVGATWDEAGGMPMQPLRKIGNLPDSVLAEIIPVWMESMSLEVRPDGIYNTFSNETDECLRSLDPAEKTMVVQYDCGRNLQVIADHLSKVSGMTRDQSFERSKTLFILLCQRGLCHPAEAHMLSEESEDDKKEKKGCLKHNG